MYPVVVVGYILARCPVLFCRTTSKIGSDGVRRDRKQSSGLFFRQTERGPAIMIHLHKQATTTPKAHAAISATREPASVLAERFGTTEQTAYNWWHRDNVLDRSHTAHRLQTTLAPAHEAVAIALRKTLLVSLNDLLAAGRGFLNPDASRSELDRCLCRHGVGNLRDLKARDARSKHSRFKAYEPGYIHIDVKYLPEMADEPPRRYLWEHQFVAIDKATRLALFGSTTARQRRVIVKSGV